MKKKNHWDNINYLKPNDEVKFIIEDREDYEWAKMKIRQYNLNKKSKILMSPSYNKIEEKEIVDWILKDNLNVKFQIQLHKIIWKDTDKGV
jgi:7-carboxy-7-deazaguanine synthase